MGHFPPCRRQIKDDGKLLCNGCVAKVKQLRLSKLYTKFRRRRRKHMLKRQEQMCQAETLKCILGIHLGKCRRKTLPPHLLCSKCFGIVKLERKLLPYRRIVNITKE